MKVLGVLGTMVWDTIWRRPDVGSPVEEWGGISYALAAADAFPLGSTRVRPLVKLGRDLAERGFRFLKELSVLETDESVVVANAPNPRVELHYTGPARRTERLTGGVPAWTWEELEPRIAGCDALYVNFITGREFGLEVARQVRKRFDGPIYVDIHSLTLTTGPGGARRRCTLDRWSEWLPCFDAVQVNQDELAALSAYRGDPWVFAADVVGRETGLLFVTLGSEGAAYVVVPEALPLERRGRDRLEKLSAARSGRVSVEAVEGGDPTGCGDVWGVTVFRSLLGGFELEEAMQRANAAASRSVAHRGASGLSRFLRGGIDCG
ncbi:MAG: carbohydrate kinase family protein [Gemmatimonadales bacterium]|jgi:sugar/nucleoside kinase (ribokinase family)